MRKILVAGFITDHLVATALTHLVISSLRTTREETDKKIASLANILEDLRLSGAAPIAAAVSLLSRGMTNLMGAAAAASVVGPITLELSGYSTLSPLFIGLLTAVSTSFRVLLIIATPPNAIIYSSGYIKPRDFLKAGVLMTVAAFGILFLVVAVWWNFLGVI